MNALRTALIGLLFLATPALADDVGEVWKARCKSCHGESGKADTKEGQKNKIADITTAEWQGKHGDAEIRKVIHDGVPDTKMKPYGEKLSSEEIDGLVKFIRTLKK